MIRIAYVDDSSIQQDLVVEWLNYYTATKGVTLNYTIFNNGEDLIADVESKGSYDIYILDIILPGIRGTDVSDKLKELGASGLQIFLTASAAFEKRVDAFGYLVKPIQPEQLYAMLDRAVPAIQNK